MVPCCVRKAVGAGGPGGTTACIWALGWPLFNTSLHRTPFPSSFSLARPMTLAPNGSTAFERFQRPAGYYEKGRRSRSPAHLPRYERSASCREVNARRPAENFGIPGNSTNAAIQEDAKPPPGVPGVPILPILLRQNTLWHDPALQVLDAHLGLPRLETRSHPRGGETGLGQYAMEIGSGRGGDVG